MNNMELEIVSKFIHLGTMFQRTGSFKKNKVNLAEKASKAMYDILNKGRIHNLSVSCHLDLFDKIIIPMLTYGSEIWGYENIDIFRDDSFDCFPSINFDQNDNIFNLTVIFRRYLPSSPYNIKFGVEVFKLSNSLQNFTCNFSNMSIFS
jgi:hypothetical protein